MRKEPTETSEALVTSRDVGSGLNLARAHLQVHGHLRHQQIYQGLDHLFSRLIVVVMSPSW